METLTYIAGVTFCDRQQHIANLKVGDRLKLIREPSNKFDNNAIQVFDVENNQLGFIPKEIAATVAPEMDDGIIYNTIVCSIKPIDYDGHLGVEILLEQIGSTYMNEDEGYVSYASEFPDMEAYESWYESSDF